MVITAWIVFIISVGLMIMHILLYKKNEAYHNRIKAIFKRKWTVVMGVLLFPILLYIIATSFLIMVQGDCFVGYYCDIHWVHYKPYNNISLIYYSGQEYNFISIYDEERLKEASEYGDGEWVDTDTYIVGERPISFPYLTYWCPKFMRNEVIVPGELEPIYIQVHSSAAGTIYYARQDVFEE